MISSKNLGKGQVSAPFEILVAVIVMGFVILAGTYALQNLSENTCLGDKRKEMGELVSAMRDVVLGSDLTFRNITFQTKACFNSKAESVQLNTYNEQSKCTAYCGSGVSCVLLEYIYNDTEKGVRYPIPPICTGLPTTINFTTDKLECGISSDDSWVPINPIGSITGIDAGRYRLFRAETASGATTASFCFLKNI
jgi:uncharacterized protein (UPF0333 family)